MFFLFRLGNFVSLTVNKLEEALSHEMLENTQKTILSTLYVGHLAIFAVLVRCSFELEKTAMAPHMSVSGPSSITKVVLS